MRNDATNAKPRENACGRESIFSIIEHGSGSKSRKSTKSLVRLSLFTGRATDGYWFPPPILKIASSSFPCSRGEGSFQEVISLSSPFIPPSISPMFIGFLSKLARGQGKKILRLYKIRRTRSDSVSVTFLRFLSVYYPDIGRKFRQIFHDFAICCWRWSRCWEFWWA